MTELQRRVRDLALYVIGPRLDWEFQLRPLMTTLLVEVNDFRKYHRLDDSGGFATLKAFDAWHAASLARMYAYQWPAQVSPDTVREADASVLPDAVAHPAHTQSDCPRAADSNGLTLFGVED